MTVGIAALCKDSNGPHVVLAADRLVTTGYTTRIEYEHTESKIEEVHSPGGVNAMAVSAGSMSLADDVFFKLDERLLEEEPTSIRGIAEETINAFHKMEREAFENQKLKPLGIRLDDFHNNELNLAPEFQRAILQDIYSLKEQIEQELNILIAGVDEDGGHIFSVQGGDIARHDGTGYYTVGSGSQSAQLTFTRNRYDKDCDLEEALLFSIEAKSRAEEAQGVGDHMDIAIIHSNDYTVLADETVEQYKKLMRDIEEGEEAARQSIIADADTSLDEA